MAEVSGGGIYNGESRLQAMEAKGVEFDSLNISSRLTALEAFQTLYSGSNLPTRVQALETTQALRTRAFTVQDGGADPLFSYNTTGLANGTIVAVSDLGGCGPNGVPGYGLVVWMGEWRRLTRGVTVTYAPGTINLDSFKDPMRINFSGSLVTTTRTLLARPFLGAKWSFVRPGLSALTNALGVNIIGGSVGSDIVLVGPAVNFIEYTGTTLTQVNAE